MEKKIINRSTGDFVHLHTHSEYSILDSGLRITELIEQAKEYGMSAVALTDNCNIMGSLRFYKEAKENGIKPIIGVEIPGLILLVRDDTGYKNLSKIITAYHIEDHEKRPFVNKKILKESHEGLVCDINFYERRSVSTFIIRSG